MGTRNIELKVGESMKVGDALVTLLEKSGQRARLRIKAEDGVKVEHPVEKAQPQSFAHKGVMLATPT